MLKIAIVGRPNVGKSTLFNRLTGRPLALVAKEPGLTRDRRVAETSLGRLDVLLIDTAGLDDAAPESLEARMRKQSQLAMDSASLVLFLIDARAGVIGADEEIAAMIRATAKPVILIANKCEGRAADHGFYDAYRLGLGEPIAISAEHGQGISQLTNVIETAVPTAGQKKPEEQFSKAARPLRVAIVGRPNAGKSTLFNALLGDERAITGPEAGITRDTIAVGIEWKGRDILLHDTAGLRRKARVGRGAEQLSVYDALNAIRFSEVTIILVDSRAPFEKQDLQIAELVAQEGRAIVIALNKWDLIRDKKTSLRNLTLETERLLPQIRGVPLLPISAIKKNGLNKLMESTFAGYDYWNRRLSTSKLNRFLEESVERHPPPAVAGRRVKLRYMTQPNARPPTFVLFSSRPERLGDAYRRYLINGLREAFDLPGVPIRLIIRKGANPYAKKRR